MKTKILSVLFVSSFIVGHSSFGQGVLTPPGAPAPTMKTLAQIEPRTPVSSLPVTITQPGSYYLTQSFDLSSGDGIFISAVNVTIDLNGFTIRSFDPGNTSVGIRIDTSLYTQFHDITILNGHIVGYSITDSGGTYAGDGFGYGIYSAGNPYNVRVAGVTVSGCLNDGINISSGFGNTNSTVVESCAVQTVGGLGIKASTIDNSVACDCGSIAIYGFQVSHCRGQSSSSYGIEAYTADNSYGSSEGGGYGVYATTANNCYGESINGTGISTTTANNCYGVSRNGGGLSATSANNCYGQCINGTGYGLYVSTLAIGCYGYSSSGTGLSAFIANTSYGSTSSGTAESVSYKYNMP